MERKPVILLTGATDGIGQQTAKELAEKDYTLIVHGRDTKKVQDTVIDLEKINKNNDFYGFVADYANLSDVSKFAEEVKKQFKKIDILINNAGIYSSEYKKSPDGYEITYQVNHLAPVLLTLKLLENIKHGEKKKIVNVASMAHASDIDPEELKEGGTHSGYEAYAMSKLCNILFTKKLAAITRPDGITVNCLHPGVINTKILKEGWGAFGADAKKGANNILYTVESEEDEHVSGAYFMDKKAVAPAQISFDEKTQDELWKITLDQLKDFL